MNHIIGILVVASAALVLGTMLWHWPHRKIDAEVRAAIKEYGLVHFTRSQYVNAILDSGIRPNNSKKLSFLEADMVWTYLNRPGLFSDNLKEIRGKAGRNDYDAVIFVRGITDDQIDKMRQRRKTNVVVHLGTLLTDSMSSQHLTD